MTNTCVCTHLANPYLEYLFCGPQKIESQTVVEPHHDVRIYITPLLICYALHHANIHERFYIKQKKIPFAWMWWMWMWMWWMVNHSWHAAKSTLCCFLWSERSLCCRKLEMEEAQSNFRFFLIHVNRVNQSAYLPLAKQLSILISRSLVILSAVECYQKVLSFSSSIIFAFSIWVV